MNTMKPAVNLVAGFLITVVAAWGMPQDGDPTAPVGNRGDWPGVSPFQGVFEPILDQGVATQVIAGVSGPYLSNQGGFVRIVCLSVIVHLGDVVLTHQASFIHVAVESMGSVEMVITPENTGVAKFKAALVLGASPEEQQELLQSGAESGTWTIRVAPSLGMAWSDVSSSADLVVDAMPR